MDTPMIFEEKYTLDTFEDASAHKLPVAEPPPRRIGRHLVVLVHGFLGNSQDIKKFRDMMLVHFPDADLFCSEINENHTEGDIGTMGERLAREVTERVEASGVQVLDRLSFVGYSLGGVIVRAALPHLAAYKASMHTFLTLSSPHLGCLLQNSSLVGAGMVIMKKVKKSKSIEQLLLGDNKDYRKCFIYKLSKAVVLLHMR